MSNMLQLSKSKKGTNSTVCGYRHFFMAAAGYRKAEGAARHRNGIRCSKADKAKGTDPWKEKS